MMFRNPHGCTEFKGAWRDGSKEWSQNPSAAKELNYVPDPNDGLFWMAKDDAFRYFQESPSRPCLSVYPFGGVPLGYRFRQYPVSTPCVPPQCRFSPREHQRTPRV